MITETTLVAFGYVFAWIGAAVALGYLAKRLLGSGPGRARTRLQSRYAKERLEISRPDH